MPPEELNRLSERKDYGWPRCFGQQRIDPTRDKPEGMMREQFCDAGLKDQPLVSKAAELAQLTVKKASHRAITSLVERSFNEYQPLR